MLPTWMIEELKRQKQEQLEQEDAERPRLQIPLYEDEPQEKPKKEEPQRGVVIIQIIQED